MLGAVGIPNRGFCGRLLVLLVAAAIPPLDAGPAERLRDGAIDGRDGIDEGFAPLAAERRGAAAWPAELPAPADLAAMIADPDAYRGWPLRVSGVIQQRRRLPGTRDAWEWFLRDGDAAPFIAFVVGLPDGDDGHREGERVRLEGRFYKWIEAVARDGATRRYAVIVAAPPRVARGSAAVPAPLIAILVLGAVALLVIARRAQRAERRPPRVARPAPGDDAAPLDAEGSLPEDPAEALAELRRRAESS